MMVVPESMIVSKLEFVVFVPTTALAPVACQKPVEVSMEWYSIEPVYLEVSVPPRNKVDPLEASLKPNTPEETTPAVTALLNQGS